MFPLDEKTLERIASVVVDIDGPSERTGRQLEQLLRRSAWPDPPEYDGSPRIPWLVEALSERRTDRSSVERLLCRVCDPVEYDGGLPVAEAMRQAVNRLLSPERLMVSYVGGRPVIGELSGSEHAVFTAPENLESRLRALVSDERVVQVLVDRVAQSRACEAAGAHLFALFGIGSFVEGLLYSVLLERFPELERTGFRVRTGATVQASRAGLDLLITTAHDKQLIQLDAKNFMQPVRDFRNFIHPRRQLESKFLPDHDTVTMCWAPVQAILNDLEMTLKSQPV